VRSYPNRHVRSYADIIAGQLGVDASDLGFYEWAGRTIEYHCAQIRDHLGYRVATVADQEELTGWLAEAVAHAERRPDRVRDELLVEFRRLRIEPPTAGRVLRMVRSALRGAEQDWTSRIAGRLDRSATSRLLDLVAVGDDDTDDADDADEEPGSLLALIKASLGNVSLESMMTEIGKLQAVRSLGLCGDQGNEARCCVKRFEPLEFTADLLEGRPEPSQCDQQRVPDQQPV